MEIKTVDLLKAAKLMGLRINQGKTKYLVVSRVKAKNDLQVDEYTFHQVTDFSYLGTNINS